MGALRLCFARTQTWQQAGKYVSAPVSELPRWNGWTVAKDAGDLGPDRMQRLLNRASRDTAAAMSEVRRFAAAGLEAPTRRGRRAGLVIAAIDECGQAKAGACTAGVNREYADRLSFDVACGDEVYGSCTRLHEFFEANGQSYVPRVASSFMPMLAAGTKGRTNASLDHATPLSSLLKHAIGHHRQPNRQPQNLWPANLSTRSGRLSAQRRYFLPSPSCVLNDRPGRRWSYFVWFLYRHDPRHPAHTQGSLTVYCYSADSAPISRLEHR